MSLLACSATFGRFVLVWSSVCLVVSPFVLVSLLELQQVLQGRARSPAAVPLDEGTRVHHRPGIFMVDTSWDRSEVYPESILCATVKQIASEGHTAATSKSCRHLQGAERGAAENSGAGSLLWRRRCRARNAGSSAGHQASQGRMCGSCARKVKRSKQP